VTPAVVAVQAVAGRPYTLPTIDELHTIGGAPHLRQPPVLSWTDLEPPPFDLPPRWSLSHWVQPPAGHRRDLWRLFGLVPAGVALIVLEDDVRPCRNALVYMERWQSDHFTTFFNMTRPAMRNGREPPIGLQPIDRKWGFWGTQAFKVPASLLRRFVAAGDSDPRPHLRGDGGDTWMSRLMVQWGEPVHYHRSLVQHVGAVSIHNPKATLTGVRAPAPDFDPNLDALELLQ